jgi:phasin
MDKDAMPPFDIPADLRVMAEKSVGQARVAFNTFMTAAQQAVATFEGQAKATQAGAKDISEKALSYAERNIANTFAFADRIVHAKDTHEFIRLQTEFIQAQMKELGEQAKELGASATKMAVTSVPLKPKS